MYSTVPAHTDMTSLSLSHSQSLCCEDLCEVWFVSLLMQPLAGKVEADEEDRGETMGRVGRVEVVGNLGKEKK